MAGDGSDCRGYGQQGDAEQHGRAEAGRGGQGEHGQRGAAGEHGHHQGRAARAGQPVDGAAPQTRPGAGACSQHRPEDRHGALG
jgi:hypothetical protein